MPRLALAGALVVAIVTFFAVFGGVGYTTSAVQSIDVSRLAQAVGKSNSNSNSNSNSSNGSNGNSNSNSSNSQGNNSQANNNQENNGPDDNEYKPGKGCGDKNHVHERENECKKLK